MWVGSGQGVVAARLFEELAAGQHRLQSKVVAGKLEHSLQEARVCLAVQLRRRLVSVPLLRPGASPTHQSATIPFTV